MSEVIIITIEEIRENAKPKHECKCEKLQEQLDALRAEYDNLMEIVDELTDENASLKGEIKGLKYAIKRFTKYEV